MCVLSAIEFSICAEEEEEEVQCVGMPTSSMYGYACMCVCVCVLECMSHRAQRWPLQMYVQCC